MTMAGPVALLGWSVSSQTRNPKLTILMSEPKKKPARMHHGAFGWAELITPDVESAKQFYAGIFGWRAEEGPQIEGVPPYTMLHNGNEYEGGLMAMPPEMPTGTPPRWTAYVTVDNADTLAEKVKELGGTVLVEPTDIPKVGRMVHFQDPQGAVLAAIQYFPNEGC